MIATGLVAVTLIAVLYIQHCPLIYYAYAGFPVFFWEEVLANRETLQSGLKVLMQGDGKSVSPLTIASQSIIYIGILESLVHDLPCIAYLRCMDTFIVMFSVFVLYLRRCGLLLMALHFGKVIRFWFLDGVYVV